MKRNRSTALLLSLFAVGAAACDLHACDKCHKSTPAKTCKNCDDAGLLDVFDAFAGHVHSAVKSKIRMPTINRSPKKCSHCDGPSCGCELRTTKSVDTHQHAVPNQQPMPLQHTPQPLNESNTPTVNRYWEESHPAPTFQNPAGVIPPAQLPTPAPAPLPDRSIDPFLDDAATKIRKVPAAPVRSDSNAEYRRQYSPQASFHMRLSDGPMHEELPGAVASAHDYFAPRDVVTASAATASAFVESKSPASKVEPKRLEPTKATRVLYDNPLR